MNDNSDEDDDLFYDPSKTPLSQIEKVKDLEIVDQSNSQGNRIFNQYSQSLGYSYDITDEYENNNEVVDVTQAITQNTNESCPTSPNKQSFTQDSCDISKSSSITSPKINTTNNSNIDSPLKNNEDNLPVFLQKYSGKMDRKEKVRLQNEYICQFKQNDVLIDKEKQQVISIGSLNKRHINSTMITKFVRGVIGYRIPDGLRTKEEVFKILYNVVVSGNTLSYIKKRSAMASRKKTFPNAVKRKGTLFRIINVITSEQGKISFIKTKKDYDREDIDSNKIPHYDLWNDLLTLYLDTTIYEYNEIADTHINENGYILRTINDKENDPSDFDELTIAEFKHATEYITNSYKDTRQKKSISGQHKPFADHVQNNKIWLLYFHDILITLGDTALTNCCFAQLPSNVLLCSTQSNIHDNNMSSSPKKRKNRPKKGDYNSTNNKEKNDELINAKINSVSAYGIKIKRTENISLNKRLNDLYMQISSMESTMNETKIMIKTLKKNIKDNNHSDMEKNELKESYKSKKIELKYKKRVMKNMKIEISELEISLKRDIHDSDSDSLSDSFSEESNE